MYPLGVFTLASAQATIEFTNIPQTYTHLQIRGIGRNSNSSSGPQIFYVNLNGDTTNSNYAKHFLVGTGSAAGSSGGSSDRGYDYMVNATFTANVFNGYLVDILDYRNTNKNKTVRVLHGFDSNGDGRVSLASNLWINTGAVTSITLTTLSGSFTANSSFALYGVQA